MKTQFLPGEIRFFLVFSGGLTVQRTVTSNSGIGSADVGYLWKQANEVIVGGVGIVQRIAAINEINNTVKASNVVGSGVRCKSMYYYGDFHINPDVFSNNIGISESRTLE